MWSTYMDYNTVLIRSIAVLLYNLYAYNIGRDFIALQFFFRVRSLKLFKTLIPLCNHEKELDELILLKKNESQNANDSNTKYLWLF